MIQLDNYFLINKNISDSSDNAYTTIKSDGYDNIINWYDSANLSLLPITYHDTAGSLYNLYDLTVDEIDNIQLFVDEVLVPAGVSAQILTVTYESYDDTLYHLYGSFFNNKTLKLAMGFILAVIAASLLFSMNRAISLYKVEGNSSFKIYNESFS